MPEDSQTLRPVATRSLEHPWVMETHITYEFLDWRCAAYAEVYGADPERRRYCVLRVWGTPEDRRLDQLYLGSSLKRAKACFEAASGTSLRPELVLAPVTN